MNNPPISYNIGSINTNAVSSANKIASLCTFVRLMDLDIILLQEVENTKLTLPGFNVITNVDENKRGTAIALKAHISFCNIQRSLDSRILTVKINDSVTICNVYAHSGSQNFSARENLFKHSLPLYLQNNTDYLILGGDFNSVIANKDATGSNSFSPSLKRLVDNLGLCDAWDTLNRNQIDYSLVRSNAASRIDRLYVSQVIVSHLRTAEYLVTSFSDHKACKIRCCLPDLGQPHGRGFWSIRAHVLNVENLDEFRRKWNYWLREKRNYISWLSWWLSYAKPKIRAFFRWKTNQAFREFHTQNEFLYRQLRVAYDGMYQNPNGRAEVNKIKAKMLNIQSNFAKAYEHLNERLICGEKISSFQIGDRVQKKKNRSISKIQKQGSLLTRAEDIESHVMDYFSNLYTAENVTANNGFPTNRVISEESERNNQLMSEISTAEIFFAIKSSAPRKSPGIDGIPKEFYEKAFDIIHPQLNLILNEMVQGNIPEKLVEGVIVLCKKPSGDETIKAYRPISLLNVDYKLLARILKQRLELVMVENGILNQSQKCSNSKHNIFEAVNGIKDRIVQLNCRRRLGKVISFDLDHAFDRVDKNFLLGVMRDIHLNREFVSLIGKIMSTSSSRILINGNLSPEFPIQRSVRQGDPLSMHLFVLYLHPLLEKLRSICNGPLDLVVAYADDISIVITDISKLRLIERAFTDFGLCSGSILNHTKTVALNIGCWQQPEGSSWPTVQQSVKILGITFFNSLKQTIEVNWADVIRKTSQQTEEPDLTSEGNSVEHVHHLTLMVLGLRDQHTELCDCSYHIPNGNLHLGPVPNENRY